MIVFFGLLHNWKCEVPNSKFNDSNSEKHGRVYHSAWLCVKERKANWVSRQKKCNQSLYTV